MPQKKRVCIVGAGPSGMSALVHFDKLRKAGKEIPEIVCYETQKEVGGLWNYTWRTVIKKNIRHDMTYVFATSLVTRFSAGSEIGLTDSQGSSAFVFSAYLIGTDEFGDIIPNSQYRYLWSNGPKECLEFPEYTFQDHFGKPIPSYPPRAVLFDYQKGRWAKYDYKSWVRLSHKVVNVEYNQETDDFTVVAKNKVTDTLLPPEKFDYVIVASGHFSVPHVPEYPGMDKFPGRILHAHDLRDAKEFAGCRMLLIGASYSAEDIALQCVKYGAKSVICTWRTKPLGFKWPPQISERPLLTKIEGKTVHFRDGSQAEFDAIILCTGYLYSFPFLGDDLRLKSANILYPTDLYRSVLWMKAANNKLLFLGMTDQYWTYTYFDVQAKWCISYIMGENKLPNRAEIESDHQKWVDRCAALKDCHEDIDFQGDLVNLLAKESNYGADLDIRDLLHTWEKYKYESILTYRDKAFTSKYTGVLSPIHHTTFMEAMDDSLECFMGEK